MDREVLVASGLEGSRVDVGLKLRNIVRRLQAECCGKIFVVLRMSGRQCTCGCGAPAVYVSALARLAWEAREQTRVRAPHVTRRDARCAAFRRGASAAPG
jgi:hypothetical protein